MTDEAPDPGIIEAAYRAALRWRIVASQEDGRYANLSDAALMERVVIVPGRMERRAGWWSAGLLVDDIAGAEWALWIHPERRLLRLLHQAGPPPATPAPTRRPDGRFYDGMRRRWLLPDGTLAPDGTESLPSA